MNTDKTIFLNLCSSVFIGGHDAFAVFQQAPKYSFMLIRVPSWPKRFFSL